MNRKWAGTLVAASAASILGCATEGPYSLFLVPAAGGGMYDTSNGLMPALDPNCKIARQDCTKPISPDGGNLYCNRSSIGNDQGR